MAQGRIVNLSSITALVVLPTGSAYGGSKLGTTTVFHTHTHQRSPPFTPNPPHPPPTTTKTTAHEAISDGLRRELADFGVSVQGIGSCCQLLQK
jgi:NADP-dependent 3-hydroxy acid dehydrogenase YdfG